MRSSVNIFRRYLSYTRSTVKPKICIVGAGPAGFYTAQHLIKKIDSLEIDMYEKLPVPFGLVRFGVAPDHPEVKNVINTFSKIGEHPNVRFVGNVTLGKDVTLQQLREAYNIVVLSYGAEQNRSLNIPGENLPNVISARNIVGWYNGLPCDADLDIDLSGPNVAIFGQGNVAIDIARVLLSPVDKLKCTDITQYALEKLSKSRVNTVHLIGRRGPLQVAFTIKELREILKLEDCTTIWCLEHFNNIAEILPSLSRPKKRLMELMLKSVVESTNCKNCKTFKPLFLRTPLKFLGSNKVEQVVLGVNKLEGCDILKQQAVLTDEKEILQCDLAVTSIGYKSVQVDECIPFNGSLGVVSNTNGRVENGLYVTGWLATGPTGVILTTMSNSFSTAELICSDLHKSSIVNKMGYTMINDILTKNNVNQIFWKDWLKIDEFEKQVGKTNNKTKEKISSVDKMLKIALG